MNKTFNLSINGAAVAITVVGNAPYTVIDIHEFPGFSFITDKDNNNTIKDPRDQVCMIFEKHVATHLVAELNKMK